MSERSPTQGHPAACQEHKRVKINRSSSVHCDIIAVIEKLSDEQWTVVTSGMQDQMMRLDFVELCLGFISHLSKSTFKKFKPVVVQIMDYDATYLEDSQLPQSSSDAAVFKGSPSNLPFVRTLRGQIRQEVKKAFIVTLERISLSTPPTGPGADGRGPALQLEEETLKVLTKRLDARILAASGLSGEEQLLKKARDITKKVVIAVLTLIESSCLHYEHPEATTILLHALAKKTKLLASSKASKSTLHPGFSFGSSSLKKVPPLLLTADFKTKATKTVLHVLLQHVKCPFVDCTAKQPNVLKAEKIASPKKCAVLPYIVTTDSLTTGIVGTVLDILVAVSEIGEESISLSATDMFGKVQHKVKHFLILHKETGMGNEKGSGGSQPFKQSSKAAGDMETEMSLAATECVDDVMLHLNEVPSTRRGKVNGTGSIASSTDKIGPKKSAKDLKLKIWAAIETPLSLSDQCCSQKGLSEECYTGQRHGKQDAGHKERTSPRVRPSPKRPSPKKPSKDFHLTAGRKSTVYFDKQSSCENVLPAETHCDKMVVDHNNTEPQTKDVVRKVMTLRIHEVIRKERSHSQDIVLYEEDIARSRPFASTVEITPTLTRITEPEIGVGTPVATAWSASQKKEKCMSQKPSTTAKRAEADGMGQVLAKLEYFINNGGLRQFSFDLTNQVCHLLEKNTCQRCNLLAGRSVSDTDLPSLQRRNDAYMLTEESVKKFLHQLLFPSCPCRVRVPEDFIQGTPSSNPCMAKEAHGSCSGDSICSSHALDETTKLHLLIDRLVSETMRVLSEILAAWARPPCSCQSIHFNELATKPEEAGMVIMASSEVELPSPSAGQRSKVAACPNRSFEVSDTDWVDINPCTGEERKNIKKNKKSNVSRRINGKRLSKKNAVSPMVLIQDTNTSAINPQEGHLQEDPSSTATVGHSYKNNNGSTYINLSDAFIQGQGSKAQTSTSQTEKGSEEKSKKQNIFARFFSSISKSVRKCFKKCRRT
ncbi:uncharacterized protein LOC125294607 [Alosa alosa]|uniref:uncharacterized protein LOC125294607 n=1 Tax=Alosa alosa TaxID=278164 RepID=UPI0020155522|nr:uncharacterized protein LOC125294607 [Alosa alosa]